MKNEKQEINKHNKYRKLKNLNQTKKLVTKAKKK